MTDAHHHSVPPLDEKLYRLDRAFFRRQTGIEDDNELKTHLLSIQAEAYESRKVHPYRCIRHFSWARPGISRLFPYQDLLKLGRKREGAILLDIGCCFGTDVRKAIVDGFPLKNMVTTDLHKEFWDLGHKLFRTTPDTFPVTFIPGNVFDPEHLTIVSPFTTNSPPVTTVPDLSTLTSLNPLRGHVSAIYVQRLLSPEPGSMVFGKQIGLPENDDLEVSATRRRFCHTTQSWSELWDGEVFPKGTVRVLAFVTEVPKDEVAKMFPEAKSLHMLTWSVTRL
ncbi:hypothetical protein EI94DRAFT_1696288 [Lactarius quietus]|nr:hypothetical protein EI94DRAFT_1696288 [Lactarius quietus]